MLMTSTTGTDFNCYKVIDIIKFYRRHSELIVKYKIGLKTLLQHGISNVIFYGDIVYKFKRIVRKPNFSVQFKKDYLPLYKGWISLGCHATVCRPGYKPNHGL